MATTLNANAKDFDTCCRTCLRSVSEAMYDIFQERTDLGIAEILSSYTTIQVDMQDKLPKKLCYSCYNCLLRFHEFKKTAVEIDTKLREHLADVTEDDDKRIVIEIKVEHGYSQSQDENDSLDHCNDSELAVKQEMSQNYRTTIYSDISDASQLEEYPDMLITDLICDICDKKFISQTKLNSHIQKHTHKYVCNICSQSFRHNFKYVEHLVKHGQVSKNKAFMTEIINNSTDQRLQCEVCSANFKSVNSLSAHKKKHTAKDRVLSCSICDKVFKKISHLKRHELCHENNRPFKCAQCPKSFSTEATLSEHVNKHNGIKPHCCPICTKSFSHLSTLTNHIKIHTREKPYLCPTCGKRFDSSTNLNQHMKRHMGLKVFACNLCPRKFVSKGELKSHGITHTGVRSYSCDQCSATFTKRSSMGKHKLRHLGIKPYQCDACPMKFTSKDHLKRHYRIHTGERPYRCDMCDRAFTQSNDLVKHTRAHLGNNLYKCSECSQSFRLKTELRQHISEHFISSQLQALKMTNTDKPQVLTDINGDHILRASQNNGIIQESKISKTIQMTKL